jgi:hypothetical protein
MTDMGYRNCAMFMVSRLKILCTVYNPVPESWSFAYSQGGSLLFGIHCQRFAAGSERYRNTSL